MQKETATKEILMEKRGYLRVPDEFRRRFGSSKKYPNPTAIIQEEGTKVRLVFEWNINELNEKRR